jgi:hypothetical protein
MMMKDTTTTTTTTTSTTTTTTTNNNNNISYVSLWLIDKYVDSVALQNCSYCNISGDAFSRFRKFLTLVQGSGIVSVADRIIGVIVSCFVYLCH